MSGDDGGRSAGRWVLVAALALLGIGVLASAVFAVQLMASGRTLASGDGWRVVARWSPLGSAIEYEEADLRGGYGDLASPGALSEAMVYVPPDGGATYVLGVLPAGASRVGLEDAGAPSTLELHRLATDVFYVLRIDGTPALVNLVATDPHGHVTDHIELQGGVRPDGSPS